ncbi:MAG TPA: metal ABC transporter substrate-binding protein [candidate division Zixibacteria bacterium]|nr:metal ABC transporter substrate-binding protein [candidate division Zixibacteria bacterium]
MKHQGLHNPSYTIILLAILIICVGCGSQSSDPQAVTEAISGNRIHVMATTTIVGDVVNAVGSDLIDLEVLLPPGSDPHVYEVTPRDIAALTEADLVFVNGLGLEALLEPVLQDAREQNKVVSVSDGIANIRSQTSGRNGEGDDLDPHVWFDPLLVMSWVDTIESALSDANPENSDAFHANAEEYRRQLLELDEWIITQIGEIPVDKRLVVTDHDSLGYFVDRYGLDLVGTVIPGYDTQIEPSAKELAQLIENIGQYGVSVVFVSDSVNTSLAEQIANDSGIRLVRLSTGSLTDDSGKAATYLDFMRANVETITNALSSSS